MAATVKCILLLSLFALLSWAYEVQILDTDYDRQICSGMWASQKTYINVSFDATSQGQVSMVIYEWTDVQYLGKAKAPADEYMPLKTYICTVRAVAEGACTRDQLGQFVLDLPKGKSVNDTSFWSARLAFPRKQSRDLLVSKRHESPNSSPGGLYQYQGPIQYIVEKTGFYCIAIVPISTEVSLARAQRDVYHPSYKGLVLFKNVFEGRLPATDYPKINFYFVMTLAYAVVAAAWGWFCYKHVHDLLPIQYYISALVGLLVIEMLANWTYYRYLNAHGKSTITTIFLVIVAILDAARNALAFFMLLVVSLGLSVVRESLGKTMLKCQMLAAAHFLFGILYAIGIVELQLESTSGLVLLLFVIPLAFTLSGFLLWIMYALNATISQLRARKQRYKLKMFQTLYYILLGAVVVIAIFFVVSSMTFSGRLAEDYAAKSWRSRWWLLDGWLALLNFATFTSIAFLWRPSANNKRLAMSDEIAQDEEDAEDYDLEAIHARTRAREDDDNATLVGGGRRGDAIHPEQVVFEIGDEEPGSDGEDDVIAKKHRRLGENRRSEEDERQGLMNDGRG